MDWFKSSNCFYSVFDFARIFDRSAVEILVNQQVHLIISGVVQGVLFRAGASRAAYALKLNGFVRNLSNGNVEVLAEGDEEALQKLIDWCRKGPLGARVDHIEMTWGEAKGQFDQFQIR